MSRGKEHSAAKMSCDDSAVDKNDEDTNTSQDAGVFEWRANASHLEEVRSVSLQSLVNDRFSWNRKTYKLYTWLRKRLEVSQHRLQEEFVGDLPGCKTYQQSLSSEREVSRRR